MNGRFVWAAVVAAGVVLCADAVVFGQGCGNRSQMHCGSGGKSEMRGHPGGGRSQMSGFPGGVSQLQSAGYNQLRGQQTALQAQLQGMQQQQTAALLSATANNGYANYVRLYNAQKKRQAELRAAQQTELVGNR